MFFTLEALKARHGDCLLLHTGTPGTPELVVVDGGWKTVYRSFLEPRLEELRQLRAPDGRLDVDLLMVSHIDEDHIFGVLDLTRKLREKLDRQEPAPWVVRELWHNSFDDIVGEETDVLVATASQAVGTAAVGGDDPFPADLRGRHQGSVVLAGVKQGRQLRLDADALRIPTNPTDSGLLLEGDDLPLASGVGLRVLGPSLEQVRELRREWDAFLTAEGLAQDPVRVAEFVDDSVFNLSSIVVLAEAAGKRMLLTGDARGDFILEAVERAGLVENGRLHVDLFKLPHHGSDHNVAPVLFETITADHYVVSGDGNYGNPEVDTFRMILAARQGDPYHLHLTYPVDELRDPYPREELRQVLEDAAAAGVTIHATAPGEKSLRIDLLDPFTD